MPQSHTELAVRAVVAELYPGITEQTFYRWKSKYSGMLPSDMKKIKQLEEENRKLKQLVAELSLNKIMLQDVLTKKF